LGAAREEDEEAPAIDEDGPLAPWREALSVLSFIVSCLFIIITIIIIIIRIII